MSHAKTGFKRIINVPGYHIHPKYDLHVVRMRRNGDFHDDEVAELPLTSMVDMFSILVIFLLMNFSSTGEVFFIQKDVKLPQAQHGHPIEALPLISISTNKVTIDAEKVGDGPVSAEESSVEMPQLRSTLQRIRIFEEALRPGQPFKGAVNVQADENVPIFHIKRVMNVLITEGWTGINFAVRTPGRKPASE